MPWIKFTQPHQVKGVAWVEKRAQRPIPEEHKDDSPLYAAGDVVEVDESHLKHFVTRGVAVPVDAPRKPAPVRPAEPAHAPEPAKAEKK